MFPSVLLGLAEVRGDAAEVCSVESGLSALHGPLSFQGFGLLGWLGGPCGNEARDGCSLQVFSAGSYLKSAEECEHLQKASLRSHDRDQPSTQTKLKNLYSLPLNDLASLPGPGEADFCYRVSKESIAELSGAERRDLDPKEALLSGFGPRVCALACVLDSRC